MKTKETFLTIDPPSGWKYGFPKAVTQEQYKLITDLKQWCIDNGYPKAEAHSYGDYFHIQINGDLSFINEDKSTREQALAWWNGITYGKKQHLIIENLGHEKALSRLTGREIEEIWRKENKIDEDLEIWYNVHKPNQKQLPKWCKQPESCGNSLSGKCICPKPNAKTFKEFDESLFKSYIDKMPESESLNMIKLIYETKLPDCKFKEHLNKWFKL